MTPFDPAMPAGDASRLFWSLKDVGYPHTTSFVKGVSYLQLETAYNYADDREHRLSRLPCDPDTCDARVVLQNTRLVNERLKGASIQAERDARPDLACRVTEIDYASTLKLVEMQVKKEAEDLERAKLERAREINAALREQSLAPKATQSLASQSNHALIVRDDPVLRELFGKPKEEKRESWW
ncbi:hypothetical protein CDEST_01264 [Colletotrichum destructivum]|uniref:Uncharacterized protein n=1 Tax=Colletotrichum destructivum TaxID=34406 RepID=A0AAX4HZ81_9PEZI|nr:hypothetical protein CDEST_01264 [Colletotrichum destructivum]